MVKWPIACVGGWMGVWSNPEVVGWIFMCVGIQTVLKGKCIFVKDG